VFFGAGMATIVFGFHALEPSFAAAVLIVGLVFGLVLVGLFAVLGPISGCHVNPAITLGAYLTRRITGIGAIVYVIAQLIGGVIGALVLLWVMSTSPFYSVSRNGLGANGWGTLSPLRISGGGAFLIEVILTAVFVLVVLMATSRHFNAALTAAVYGGGLALVNMMGIPFDGASVNPARSLGPAIVVGGQALSQVWLFLVAPLVGAILATAVYLWLHPQEAAEAGLLERFRPQQAQPAVSHAGAEEGRPAGVSTATTADAPASASQSPTAARPGEAGQADPPPAGGMRKDGLLAWRRLARERLARVAVVWPGCSAGETIKA
jgi:aquaporin Z